MSNLLVRHGRKKTRDFRFQPRDDDATLGDGTMGQKASSERLVVSQYQSFLARQILFASMLQRFWLNEILD